MKLLDPRVGELFPKKIKLFFQESSTSIIAGEKIIIKKFNENTIFLAISGILFNSKPIFLVVQSQFKNLHSILLLYPDHPHLTVYHTEFFKLAHSLLDAFFLALVGDKEQFHALIFVVVRLLHHSFYGDIQAA